jgi:glycosyltransferase involved in cell wall biosynthesis
MNSSNQTIKPVRPTLGVVIRFKNSAATLPAVIAALRNQTVQPDMIVAVNNESTDNSVELLRAGGARIVDWTKPYHHSRVLNFALEQCPTDLVLVLSSHTVLCSPTAIEQMHAAMADPQTACASSKWDDDVFYSDAIDWAELERKGLKFGSIYSNSMGVLRRALWLETRFDESLVTMEDYAWTLTQVKRGYKCRRLDFGFSYQRGGRARDFTFALTTFQLAAKHGLTVAWLGVRGTIKQLAGIAFRRLTGRERAGDPEATSLRQRLIAWSSWRFVRLNHE